MRARRRRSVNWSAAAFDPRDRDDKTRLSAILASSAKDTILTQLFGSLKINLISLSDPLVTIKIQSFLKQREQCEALHSDDWILAFRKPRQHLTSFIICCVPFHFIYDISHIKTLIKIYSGLLIFYLSEKKCQWKIANSETSRLCGNYAAIFLVDHENLHSIPWRCSFVSLCTFIPDQIFLDVRYLISEICVCVFVEENCEKQAARCKLLANLLDRSDFTCKTMFQLKWFDTSLVRLPSPTSNGHMYKSRWPENQMWGTFFTLFKGLFIRASWSQKGEGV